MRTGHGAIAKERDVAWPLFQHEREILGADELRMVEINGIEPHDGTGDFHCQRRFGWMVDDYGKQTPEHDRRDCSVG